MTTGIISPSWSLAEVLALNTLQNSMMFTPCWPRAGPTGGAGGGLSAGVLRVAVGKDFFGHRNAPQTFSPLLLLEHHVVHAAREVHERAGRDADRGPLLERDAVLGRLVAQLFEDLFHLGVMERH